MILKHLENCVNSIYNDVMEKPSKNLVELLKSVEEDCLESVVRKGIVLSLHMSLITNELSDEFFEEVLLENIAYILERTPSLKKSITIKVELVGLEKELYRIIEIPYGVLLSDLAYIVLASMEAEGSHLFMMHVPGYGKYGCDACDYDDFDGLVSEIALSDIEIRKGMKMRLVYDFGDDYVFNIEVMDINDYNEEVTMEDVTIIEGKGHGIWEDGHMLLELYYKNHRQFVSAIHEVGLDEEDFYTDDFDVKLANEFIIDEYEDLMMIYEMEED